ncbi:hypothetical protein D9M68_953950 [compost metagenome]
MRRCSSVVVASVGRVEDCMARSELERSRVAHRPRPATITRHNMVSNGASATLTPMRAFSNSFIVLVSCSKERCRHTCKTDGSGIRLPAAVARLRHRRGVHQR